MRLFPTCRQVATLLVANEDREIGTLDRLRVRVHLAVCRTCPNFERQLLTMRNAMRQWRNYTGNGDSGTAEPPPGRTG